jgi:thiol-disulfide isomerase/thioredoxin
MKTTKLLAICVALLTLGAVIVLGLRDIHKFQSGPAVEPASAETTTSASASTSSSDKDVAVRFVKDPLPAPIMSLTLLDGRRVSSADWRGKVVLVNFWATWCGPCQEEIPDLVRLQEKYPDQLVILGLSQDSDPPAKVKAFAQGMKINYPVAMSTPEIERQFGGVFGLPTSFVLDTEQRVVQRHIGLRNPLLYETEIRALLNLPVPVKIERFEDTGQVMLANAKNATEYPGVDLSKLSADQKLAARRQLNETECTCGCGLTVAQCLVNDTSCDVSKGMAKKVVDALLAGKPPSLAPKSANP